MKDDTEIIKAAVLAAYLNGLEGSRTLLKMPVNGLFMRFL